MLKSSTYLVLMRLETETFLFNKKNYKLNVKKYKLLRHLLN